MVAIKVQRKRKSRRCQRSLTDQREELLPQNQKGSMEINVPIRSMITGQWMDKGDALRDWQEFIFMRQEKIEKKLQDGDLSEYTRLMEQVDQLLEGQSEKVSEAVTELIVSATYMHYNKGFFDGMKIGMVMGNL
ncbi:hypothetical protein [Pelosinus baikalensis]|uniref:Uncharacterized protein n=1 Tax=Pelosinus baikalensis TaxID=2892015 RepID=A0ABS8HR61_9FIRM|nr:hypothetical protein [Pelosinus baikalensis]MCC5465402.1 hypothetical protein [Pelosinus baikalensis]